MVHCRPRRTNFGYPKQSGHQEFREQGKTALISCCNELAAYRRVCDRCCHEIWLLLLKCNSHVLVSLRLHWSVLFVERSWCASRLSSRSHKPVSKTWKLDFLPFNNVEFVLCCLYFECTHRRSGASIFAGESVLKCSLKKKRVRDLVWKPFATGYARLVISSKLKRCKLTQFFSAGVSYENKEQHTEY